MIPKNIATHPKHEDLAAGWWSTYPGNRKKCDIHRKETAINVGVEVEHRRHRAICAIKVLTGTMHEDKNALNSKEVEVSLLLA